MTGTHKNKTTVEINTIRISREDLRIIERSEDRRKPLYLACDILGCKPEDISNIEVWHTISAISVSLTK